MFNVINVMKDRSAYRGMIESNLDGLIYVLIFYLQVTNDEVRVVCVCAAGRDG